jgi:UDP-N-acetylglucosamine 2-epimerase (non-hydrolysing)/GDP/UDP-N,N'-diacetylbacillosamine 2-epimerase (hydrolysing)
LSSERRICVVTGSRAEYGLLYWLLREIQDDPALDLQLAVTGTHLSPEFGLTYRLIEEDGFVIDAKVDMLLAGDSPAAIAKSMGLAIIGFADAFERLRPDVVVVLGDRYEIMAAAEAAMVARIPIAHISGGEITEGAIDDSIRHCLTKMAAVHFVSAEPYRQRVIQLGEDPERVINCGDPGVERVMRTKTLERAALASAIGFDVTGPFFLVTYHPETVEAAESSADVVRNLFQALDQFPDHRVVVTKANADEGGRLINALIDAYAAANPERVHASASLGQLNYTSAMRHCEAVVGNSSSGIVEAPAMGKPTVNIGTRQQGRLMAASVISTGHDVAEILAALRHATSAVFRASLDHNKPLYGSGNTAQIMKDTLKTIPLGTAMKRFHDLPGVAQ